MIRRIDVYDEDRRTIAFPAVFAWKLRFFKRKEVVRSVLVIHA
jgi:hypothetical protein